MKIVSAFLLAISIAAPAMAAERAQQLPPIDAGTIWAQINNQHNPFPQPQPTTLDYCNFTEFKNNKCIFKCQSGVTLTEPAVKPDFSSGEPAGPCATLIIRPIPASLPAKSADKVNPFPNPSNPDSCYLLGMNEQGLCRFKCRTGETFQVKPVKPGAASVYEKCGADAYRGADKSAGVQTYESHGKYPSAQKASEVMTWAVNGLKSAKASVTGQTIVVHGLSDYRFRLTFSAGQKLAIEPSPVYRAELDAYERMFDMADRLEADGNTVAIHEVAGSASEGYHYVIGFFPGTHEADRSAAKKLKVCWFKTVENDNCVYKCKGGATHIQPMQRPDPWSNEPVIACPQLVFPF